MENPYDGIKYGWLINDVVGLDKPWCVVCAKARWHEQYSGWLMCLWCGEKTEIKPVIEEAPAAFQIERFIREGL